MLEINKFNKIIAANWKLNGSIDFINSYFSILKLIEIKKDVCGVIFPPHIYLSMCSKNIPSLYIGGQNCSNFINGAFTGDISALMIKDINCNFCLLGHSERRQFFNESNEDIFLKTTNAIKADINPIICVGETLEEKKNGDTKKILAKQITECIPKKSSNNIIIIAYEPIWAIGSGLTPTLEEIESIHSFIKNDIEGFENFKILYGGSVKASNSKEIMNLDNVDGVLVGGASLDPHEFSKILTV